MRFKFIYGFNFKGTLIYATLPEVKTFKRQAMAEAVAGREHYRLILLPKSIHLISQLTGAETTYTDNPEERRLLEFLIMKKDCLERLGPPLGPDEITALMGKGTLDETIFSEAYIIDEDKDFLQVDWKIAGLYGFLLESFQPDTEHSGQRGFTFGSSCYGANEVMEPVGVNRKVA